MATATYEPIATTTLSTASASITFSSIAATWTDLRVVFVGTLATYDGTALRVNGDTGTNYSGTHLSGNGSGANSTRATNQSYIYCAMYGGFDTAKPGMLNVDFMRYGGSTYKTVLVSTSNDLNGYGIVERAVGLWRNTAAITSVTLFSQNGYNLNAGTTATLFGVKAA